MVSETDGASRADAPPPPVFAERQEALNRKLARLNKYRLVLAIDSSLPKGIARCTDCGRFASEESPAHTCPVPGMIAEGMPRSMAVSYARAGFGTKVERHIWSSAIHRLGVEEAGAFRELGYSPFDAKRLAREGQSGMEMLREVAEIAEAAEAPASEDRSNHWALTMDDGTEYVMRFDPATGVLTRRLRNGVTEHPVGRDLDAAGAEALVASEPFGGTTSPIEADDTRFVQPSEPLVRRGTKVVRPPQYDTVAAKAAWAEAREVQADGVEIDLKAEDIRRLMRADRQMTGARIDDDVVITADGAGNLSLSTRIMDARIVLHDADSSGGKPWMAVVSHSDVRDMLKATGPTMRLGFADGKVTAAGVTANLVPNSETRAQIALPPTKAKSVEFSDEMAAAIKDVARFAGSSDDTHRPALSRINVERGSNGGLVAVATNSYMMRVRADASEIPGDGGWGADRAAEQVAMLPASIATKGVNSVRWDRDTGRTVMGANNGQTVTGDIPAADYPNWRQIAASSTRDAQAVTIPNLKGMRKAMKDAVSDSAPIRVATDRAGRVQLQGFREMSSGVREATVAYSDPDFDEASAEVRVALNADYLAEALEGHDGSLTMHIQDRLKPVICPHPRGLDLLMPVRLT